MRYEPLKHKLILQEKTTGKVLRFYPSQSDMVDYDEQVFEELEYGEQIQEEIKL